MGAAASIEACTASIGQDLIDEFHWGARDARKAAGEVAELMKTKGILEEQAKAEFLERYRNLPPIRLVDFEDFKEHGEIPRLGFGKSERFPSAPCVDLTIPFTSVDRGDSLIVYVSHCWMAGFDGLGEDGHVLNQQSMDAWRGYPHPDDKANNKFKLTVEGIESIVKTMAPGCKTYIWQDFSCMDQNGSTVDELKQLDKIIEMSDIIFTPIVDPSHETWEYPKITGWQNCFKQYAAKTFSVGPHAYVNRAWCRVEMLYGANIPLRDSDMLYHFRAGLKAAVKMNLRPHYLYGDKEKSRGMHPYQLPPLAHSHLETLSPANCMNNLTVASDADKIVSLMTELEPYLKGQVVGYDGTMRDGKRNGKGKLTFADGGIYEGDHKNDNIHGSGKFYYANGNVYEGTFKDDNMHGKGKYHIHAKGSTYEGDWKDSKRHGKGTVTYASGSVYQGDYKDNNMHGKGIYRYACGNVYVGDFVNDNRHGKGKFTYASGNVYDGDFTNDNIHGKGVFTLVNGNVYEGDWEFGKMIGKGKLTYEHGEVYEGDWKDGHMHGKGKFIYASGDVFEGEWKDNNMNGHGKFIYANGGEVYEGEWKDGNMHGKGKYIYTSGDIYEGEWKDDKRHGHGKYTYKSGEVYEGDYKDNNTYGKGTVTCTDGNVYEADCTERPSRRSSI